MPVLRNSKSTEPVATPDFTGSSPVTPSSFATAGRFTFFICTDTCPAFGRYPVGVLRITTCFGAVSSRFSELAGSCSESFSVETKNSSPFFAPLKVNAELNLRDSPVNWSAVIKDFPATSTDLNPGAASTLSEAVTSTPRTGSSTSAERILSESSERTECS